MIGGGYGAFIGAIHRTAADITGDIDLVAGAAPDQQKNRRILGLD